MDQKKSLNIAKTIPALTPLDHRRQLISKITTQYNNSKWSKILSNQLHSLYSLIISLILINKS